MKQFFGAVVIGFLLFGLAGCGPSKKDRAVSQVNVVAEEMTEITGDGWYKRITPEEVDPWGNKLRAKYTRKGGRETLTVISNGPDGLPHTRDDIHSDRWTIDNKKVLEAIAKAHAEERQKASEQRQKNSGGYSEAVTGGATKGIIKGIRERNKSD